ncbi:hypothetical protein [Streptomyces sp. NPDC058193]|uniref:hypothetical protein n=1 Tax=Streptomyces sp. NPDC058193 TaxID=3346373 RepID=UPI0036E61592
MSRKSEKQVAESLKQIAAATAGTAVGGAIGGPGGALAGAAVGPTLVASYDLIAARIASQRAARSNEVISTVSSTLGIESEQLEERLLADDRLLEFAGRVVRAAQEISLTQKRRALARSLAAAVADPDPARLDVWELLQTAIAEIDPPHIRFMHVISSARPLPKPPSRPDDSVKYGITLDQVCSRDPGLEVGAYAVLQKLISLGLVESALNGMIFGDTHRPYALSQLGQNLLTLLVDDPSPEP